MEEIWKVIPRLGGDYQISNKGRVKHARFGADQCLTPAVKANKQGKSHFLQYCMYQGGKVRITRTLVSMLRECFSPEEIDWDACADLLQSRREYLFARGKATGVIKPWRPEIPKWLA